MEDIKNLIFGKTRMGSFVRILILLTIAAAPFSHYYRFAITSGVSMEPTIGNGQILLMRKSGSLGKKWIPRRFDVIVAGHTYSRKYEHITKRVIGLPGETLQVEDNNIYINGDLLYETFGNSKFIEHGLMKPVIIPSGYVWVIGDNRDYTFYGLVKVSDILGKIEW